MANDDNQKWHLPEALDITKNPAVRLQAEQMRRDLEKRAVSPFARLSPTEFAKVRAAARIEHLFQSLQVVDQQLRSERGRVSHHQLHEARNALAARLAENLAVVENYSLAAELHPDPAHRQEYAKQVRRQVSP